MANVNSYPGISAIKDSVVVTALRILWDKLYQVEILAKGPTQGTLSPDTKPVLGGGDTGTLFYSTDYNRLYRWSGSAWLDDPTAPTRFEVTRFFGAPEPATGWVPCDGRQALFSTSSGGTTYFQVPVIPVEAGLTAYIRA